jgi:transposase
MLVQGAHYILGPFGEHSDLRRWGLKLAARGGKNAKKRAVVAVARKLAVLLHRLWVSGEVYEPLRNSQKAMRTRGLEGRTPHKQGMLGFDGVPKGSWFEISL